MDTARGIAPHRTETDPADAGIVDTTLDIGNDERRMHVRAYNHWVSLLKERQFPAIGDLDPAGAKDFGPHGVLLDFSGGIEDPGIRFVGRKLRVECAIDHSITRISEVPPRSLLSRLTDHYLQIIANRAPIGFEAEFVANSGSPTLYRGILMPFSSDGAAIDFVYGVINWKEMADPQTQAALETELTAAGLAEHMPTPEAAPLWAAAPTAPAADAVPRQSLSDALALARESAAAVRAADTRGRSALYRALGRAHDFVCAARREPVTYGALLEAQGIKVQARAPMTPAAKLVFGRDYDKTRLTEFATVLAHAERHGVAPGGLAALLDATEGGIKAIVRAERDARRPVSQDAPAAAVPVDPAIQIRMAVDAAPGAYVLLLARAGRDGTVEIVGQVTSEPAALRRAAGPFGRSFAPGRTGTT